jgi:hypothetical protein
VSADDIDMEQLAAWGAQVPDPERTPAEVLPVRTPSAALPIDIWAEAHAHTALALAENAMTREFTEWLETLPEVLEP